MEKNSPYSMRSKKKKKLNFKQKIIEKKEIENCIEIEQFSPSMKVLRILTSEQHKDKTESYVTPFQS